MYEHRDLVVGMYRWWRWSLVAIVLISGNISLLAVVEPDRGAIGEKLYRADILTFPRAIANLDEFPASRRLALRSDLGKVGAPSLGAHLDRRTNRWATLMPSTPLIPGRGNVLRWSTHGFDSPPTLAEVERVTANRFREFLQARRVELKIEDSEVRLSNVVASHPDFVQIYAQRVVGGVLFRDTYLTAVVNHGNLILFGAVNWGDLGQVSTAPRISSAEAMETVTAHLAPFHTEGSWARPVLKLVPVLSDPALEQQDSGSVSTLGYRLVWVVRPRIVGESGRWEALVDAHAGELLAVEDTTHFAASRRHVVGGVYPVSNDGTGSEGSEQAGWPMPFETLSGASTAVTDAGGNLPVCVDGDIVSDLSGSFVAISDNCGPISLSSASDVDFGTSAGTDCTSPGVGGAGNTHASRTAFYELNRIAEQARSQLPGNAWLTEPLTANMNIPHSCNATWSDTVNFFRLGGGCANTGELAGVIDHEWGHGLDDNDVTGLISRPGEGIADIYAYLRLGRSCIGRGFWLGGTSCGGYGDPCTSCDGVRDIDYTARVSGLPHDLTWIAGNCGSGGFSPCGGSVHCEGAASAEAVYNLIETDLPAFFGMDHNTALELGTRLTYQGAGLVGDWFTCTPPYGGCNADGGYLNYLAADDDNGNLADGTPHMSAIFSAFDRNQIACASPPVVDSGCAGAPAVPPTVSATGLDRGASLSWGSVPGAVRYQVFRADGVSGCAVGKVKVGETSGTTFVDDGLRNGRAYWYIVIPIGSSETCMGPASPCTAVTPVAGGNLFIDEDSASWTLTGGDGDDFLDNCETGTLSFQVSNIGNGVASNARIVGATSPSHPAIAFSTSFPTALTPTSVSQCDLATGTIEFVADGMGHSETVEIQVEVTTDELAVSKFATFTIGHVETDLLSVALETFSFETDADGWVVSEGIFNRTSAGGGANATNWRHASSAFVNNQCDRIRSPILRLTPSSTMSLWSNFDIEGQTAASWYDRANIGVVEANESRTLVTPDGGRLYNAHSAGPGIFAGCNAPEEGWAGSQATWATSQWSATALQAATLAGQPVALEIVYATDPAGTFAGFSFDEVTLTDFEHLVPDGQACGFPAELIEFTVE